MNGGRDSALSRHDPWVAYYRPNRQARVRLFCFAYAGGGASVFRAWDERLPRQIDVCPIQLPGRESRFGEPPFDRLKPLVETLAQVLRPRLDMPFALWGHSLGALVSFELARELRRQHGPTPAYLFVAGCEAPHLAGRSRPIHNLPEPELVAELRRLNGTPHEVLEHAELMQLLIPVLRADLAASETYAFAAEPPLDCPLLAVGGQDDPEVLRENLEAWRQHTNGPFQVRVMPGDHFFLHPAQALVLSTISDELSRRGLAEGPAGELAPGHAWHFPAQPPALTADQVHVWRAALDRPAAELDEFWRTLSPDEQQRAERFVFPKDRDHFVAGRGILRALLGRYLSREPGQLTFCYTERGKPMLGLESGGAALRFNLAHSGGLALYAVARDRELGVDLERIRPDFPDEQIARRFFSPAENECLQSLPPERRAAAFFTCWTRKEAYLKATSLGFSLALDSFDVSLAPGQPAALLAARHDPREVGRWTFHDLAPACGFVAAVAGEGTGWRLWCGQWPAG